MYDIAIIGAGVVGAMTARELSKYSVSVCVLEKENDVALGATKANSAIVHAGFDTKPKSLKAKLNVKGSEMMPNIAKELGVKYQNNGSLVLGFDENDRKVIEQLFDRGTENGVKGLKILDSTELHKLEPNLSGNAKYALYAPSGAIVCPYELCIAAMGNAMDNGADLKLNFEVKAIKENGGYYTISSDTDSVDAAYIINASGIYSDKIARMAGDDSFDIHPRRGEYILLDKECGGLAKHTIFQTPSDKGKGILISPTVDGNLLCGPTAVDMTDKTDKSTTAEGFARIISEAHLDIESIPFNKTITSFCGLRAVGSTGDFIINSPKPNFINAAGIESPGLSASPAIAEYIVGLLIKSGANLKKKESFNPHRAPYHTFRESSPSEKNRIIKEYPEYGRVICRCETVTEGEIINAIRTNPGARDIDGVKRRTRAGMGRCQGGFCLPYVAEILSRELDIPFEEITKSEQNSNIVIGKTKGVRQ